MGRGRGRGRPDDRPPGGGFDDRRGGPIGRGRFDNFKDDTTFSVPSDKCGLVIGKGTVLPAVLLVRYNSVNVNYDLV